MASRINGHQHQQILFELPERLMTEPSNTIDISPRVCGNILRRHDDDPVEETTLDERVIVTEDLRELESELVYGGFEAGG